MKRGEIWTVAGGPDYSGKPRPSVIVQDERFDTTDSVSVCGMTTTIRDASFSTGATVRPQVEPSETNGLTEVSQVMVDKITTVPVNKLRQRVGVLSDTDLEHLDQALLLFLGLVSAR